MLTVYLTAFVIGGFFVGLAALAGSETDTGVEVEGLSADADVDISLDSDGSASIAEASHGVRKGTRRGFNPLASFRFWTFSSTFFGLTGGALTLLGASVEPLTAMISVGMGISSGLAVSWLVNSLRTPVSSGARSLSDYVGRVGPLSVTMRPGGTSKVRLRLEEQDIEILAVSSATEEIPKGTQVVVLGFNADGLARVALDQTLYLEEE